MILKPSNAGFPLLCGLAAASMDPVVCFLACGQLWGFSGLTLQKCIHKQMPCRAWRKGRLGELLLRPSRDPSGAWRDGSHLRLGWEVRWPHAKKQTSVGI